MRAIRHSWLRRSLQIGLPAIPIAVLAGCVQQTTDGPATEFRYELWVPMSVLFAGLVAAPAGWFLRKRSAKYGWGLLIIAPLAVFAFAPSLFRDRVSVDDDGFHVRTGIWGMTSVHDVKFDDLRSVKLISETTSGRRKRTNYFFLCEMKTGEPVKVPVNNEVSKASAGAILQRVAGRGIPIVDEL